MQSEHIQVEMTTRRDGHTHARARQEFSHPQLFRTPPPW